MSSSETTLIESDDLEVVYSSQVKDPEINRRFKELANRLQSFEARLPLENRESSQATPNPAATRETGWIRKNAAILALWVAGVTLVVAGLAWWQPQWKQHSDTDQRIQVDRQIDEKLKDPLRQITDQRVALAAMTAKMGEISDLLKVVAGKQMTRISALPPESFRNNLSEVKTVLKVARIENAQASPETVRSLQSRFLSVRQDEPGFWGAATAFIS